VSTYPLYSIFCRVHDGLMFLHAKIRKKDGKVHRYFSVVENHVLYLGELNDSQRAGWIRTIEQIDGDGTDDRQLALFPHDRDIPDDCACAVAQIKLDRIQLHRPRQWGACWLALRLWDYLDLDVFWCSRLPISRKGNLNRPSIHRLDDSMRDRRWAKSSAESDAEREQDPRSDYEAKGEDRLLGLSALACSILFR